MKKIMRTWKAKHQSKFHVVQAVYRQWEADFPTLENEYDVAIGYLEGVYNYFILDKVRAGRKIIWVHNNYDNLGYNPVFDFDYFVEADVIATMSPIAKESLQRNFPELADRIRFIENITDAGIVRKMAEEPIGEDGFAGFNGLKIISCGRLATQKAFERAIMAAVLIKKAGIPFRWIVIGDGPKKKELVRLKKDMKVDEDFRLAGLKENPYPYMRQADMLVVTSLYEGRSVVIDEAKILGTPVITTDYPTAADAVEHGKTGLICAMTPKAIAEAIIRLYEDKALDARIRQNLIAGNWDNTDERKKYIEVIEG